MKKPGCIIIGIVRSRPETREELRKILESFVEPTRREEGCISYHMHVSEVDPDYFMFYETWRSKKDLDDHLDMPYLAALRDRGEELLAGPVEIQYYRMASDPA